MTDLAALAQVPPGPLRSLVHAELMRRSFAHFMRWAFPLDPKNSEDLTWNWHLDAKAEHLEAAKRGEIKRLIINEPPRHLKSWTTSVAFPTWDWIDDPWRQVLATSADGKLTLKHAESHLNLCNNKEFIETFRLPWRIIGPEPPAKGDFANSVGGHRISRAIGARIIGNDADLVIFDDPLSPSDAFSDKAQLGAHSMIAKQDWMTRLNNPATGIIIVIMQRLHDLDLSGVFLADGGWEHLCLPSEYVPKTYVSTIGWHDPREDEGELLFPERFPAEWLDEQKAPGNLGSRGYAGQHQQSPTPAEGAMVMRSWLQYWTPDTLPEMDYIVCSWDPPRNEKAATEDSDFVVGLVLGVHGDNVYLLDQCREKMAVPEMLDALRDQVRLWPNALAIIIEEKAAGKHVMQMLEMEIPGIEGFNPQGQSKQERLGATLPLWEAGRVFLPHPHLCSSMEQDYSWVLSTYVPEITTFPGSAYDDQVDATSQALIWIMLNGPSMPSIKVLG